MVRAMKVTNHHMVALMSHTLYFKSGYVMKHEREHFRVFLFFKQTNTHTKKTSAVIFIILNHNN